MADEYFIKSILREAKKQELLTGKINPCVIETINHANLMIKEIREDEGISTEQVAYRVGLHVNTVRIFLRVLKDLKIIESYRKDGEGIANFWRMPTQLEKNQAAMNWVKERLQAMEKSTDIL